MCQTPARGIGRTGCSRSTDVFRRCRPIRCLRSTPAANTARHDCLLCHPDVTTTHQELGLACAPSKHLFQHAVARCAGGLLVGAAATHCDRGGACTPQRGCSRCRWVCWQQERVPQGGQGLLLGCGLDVERWIDSWCVRVSPGEASGRGVGERRPADPTQGCVCVLGGSRWLFDQTYDVIDLTLIGCRTSGKQKWTGWLLPGLVGPRCVDPPRRSDVSWATCCNPRQLPNLAHWLICIHPASLRLVYIPPLTQSPPGPPVSRRQSAVAEEG